MTTEEIIKEAFSQGWNASHECATDFDYEYSLNNCISEINNRQKTSICDECTAYPFLERGKTPLCKSCDDYPLKK